MKIQNNKQIIMKQKRVVGLRARLNTEILTKTEMALSAINNVDLNEQSITNLYNPFNPRNMLTQLDQEYCRLTVHKRTLPDVPVRLQVFAYSQEYFSFDMRNYVFPIRILLTNVYNTGILFVGYDKQYPGVDIHNKSDRFHLEIQRNQEKSNQKNYDYTTLIDRDVLIHLKDKNSKNVQTMYFTFIAKESLFMVTFKVETVGLSKNMFRIQKSLSAKILNQKIKTLESQLLGPPQQKIERKGSQEIAKSKNSIQNISLATDALTQGNFYNLKDKSQSLKKIEQKNYIALNTSLTKKEFSQLKQVKKSSEEKFEENKKKKQMFEQFKMKDFELRQTANKCKRLIQNYEKIYNIQNSKKNKLNRSLIAFLYATNFAKKTNYAIHKRIKAMDMTYKIHFLCKRFVKNVKKRYIESVLLINSRPKRNMMGVFAFTTVLGKLLHKECTKKAAILFDDLFRSLQTGLIMNHVFNSATVFRSKIRIIQRAWKCKSENRRTALYKLIRKHVTQMIKEFPHLKLFVNKFQAQEIYNKITSEYIKDEGMKFRSTHSNYLQKLLEIEEFEERNQSIAKYNERSIEKHKKKDMLVIPKRPTKPMHRFFRNVDILRSMVRSWFEIEYKKWLKKNTA